MSEEVDISKALKAAIATGKVEFGVDQTENAVKAGALSSQTKRLTTTNSKQLCDSVRAIANLDSVYIAAFRSINPKIESRLKYVWEHHESTWTEPYRNSAGATTDHFSMRALRNTR